MPPVRQKKEPCKVEGLCIDCGIRKQRFRKHRGVYDARCQQCLNKKYLYGTADNPGKIQVYARRQTYRKYKITEEQHEQMMKDQSLCCAICQKPETVQKLKFSIDHCHETGKIRGLLCINCNLGLGRFEDNADRFRRAADYLEGK